MANTEHIEAKLCAFVDGELDDAGRAEIEAHLQANPQHRQLLAELMEQRQLLRELPRERAPLDLNESLQTQLERSVLFDDKSETPYVAGRINRWPPIVLAAVLLLSVGLLTIIYFILPDQRINTGGYATITTTSPVTESDGIGLSASAEPTTALATATPAIEGPDASAAPAVPAAPSDSLAMSDTLRSQYRLEGDVVREFSKAGPATEPTGAPGALAHRDRDIFAKGGPDSWAMNTGTSANFFNRQTLDPDTSSRLENSPAVRDNSALLVVSASDPAACNREVTEFLKQNSIQWEPLPEPMPAPIELKKDDVVASKMPRSADRQRLAKGGAEFKEKTFGQEQKQEQVAQAPAPATTTPTLDALAGAPAPAPESAASQQVGQQQQQIAQLPARGDVGDKELRGAGSQPAQQQIEQLGIVQSKDGAAQVIVARNLTRQQVVELWGCVAPHASNETQIANYNRSTGVTPPATQFALEISRRRALGAGTRELTLNQQVATTQPVELERGLLDAAKSATTAPTVAADATATTQPAQVAAVPPTVPPPAEQTPAGQPLTPLPVPAEIADQRLTAGATAPAATQPLTGAGMATQPVEEPIDVVIVLQPQSPAATIAPVTSPAAASQPTP